MVPPPDPRGFNSLRSPWETQAWLAEEAVVVPDAEVEKFVYGAFGFLSRVFSTAA